MSTPPSAAAKILERACASAAHFDEGKPRWDLFFDFDLGPVVDVCTYGAHKYDDKNWLKGMKWSKVFGSLLRHLVKFWWYQVWEDDESKLPHLAHASWCVLALLTYASRGIGEDDRPQHMAGEVPQGLFDEALELARQRPQDP